jgi:hypothetical protein
MDPSDVVMSSQKFLKNYLGLLSLIIGLAIGLLVIALSYFLGINQYGIGFAIFGASLLYLLFFKSSKSIQYKDLFFELNPIKKTLLNLLFFSIYSVSILIISFDQYHRSLIYFIFISLLAALILIDILATNNMWFPLIGFKILLLAVNIRIGLFFEFNGLSGGDIWTHAKMISDSLDIGAITASSMAYSKYFYYPIFHSLISIVCLLGDISIKNSIFYSVILINILTSFIIYKIGNMVGQKRVSLLAILIYLISDIPILKTTLHIEPTTIVIIYFSLMLWLLIKQKRTEHIILILILFISMILAHQLATLVSLYIVIIFLSSIWIFHYFSPKYRLGKKMTTNYFYLLLFMCIMLLFYWQYSYVSYGSKISFFEFSLQPFVNVFKYGLLGDLDSQAYVMVLSSYDFVSNILFQLGYFILLFFTVFGLLYWLNNLSPNKFAITSAIIGLYVIIWGMPLTKIGNAGIFTRWLIFVYFFMIFPAADAILLLSSQLYTRIGKSVLFKYIPLIILFILCFSMITTPYINGDSPIHSKDRWPRSMFKDTELIAADTISRIYSNTIITDGLYPMAFSMSSFTGNFQQIELDSKKDSRFALLLRTCALNEPVGIKSYGYELGISKVIGQDYFNDINENHNLSCVYNNNGTIFYIPVLR